MNVREYLCRDGIKNKRRRSMVGLIKKIRSRCTKPGLELGLESIIRSRRKSPKQIVQLLKQNPGKNRRAREICILVKLVGVTFNKITKSRARIS